MAIICIQCAMEDILTKGQPLPQLDETLEAHMQRCHPDPIATKARRIELERLLMERLKEKGLKEKETP